MATHLMYFKIDCPVECAYCFEEPYKNKQYDVNAMLDTLQKNYQPGDSVVFHGGEICTLPIKDLERSLEGVRKIIGSNGISMQSSLYGMKPDHIRLFKKYNVGLGISRDGPPELNILRGPRNPQKNEVYQKELLKNLDRLDKNNISVGNIAILSKVNTSGDNLEKLVEWAKQNKIEGRFNPMFLPYWQMDNEKLKDKLLTPQELKDVWIRLAEECLNDKTLMWNPMREFVDNLLGVFNLSPCIVGRCDYTTTICKTIMGDGTVARCDRCFQEGYYLRGLKENTVRSEMLAQTECSDCRYIEICGGGCPGEGVDGDYRHKSYFCEAYYGLYEYLETKIRGLIPNIFLTIDDPNYFENQKLGKRVNPFRDLTNGTWRKPNIHKDSFNTCDDLNECECQPQQNRPHGDHYDNSFVINKDFQGNRPHGDHYDKNHYNNIKEHEHGNSC